MSSCLNFFALLSTLRASEELRGVLVGDLRSLPFLLGVVVLIKDDVDLRVLDFLTDLCFPGVFLLDDDVTLFLVLLEAGRVDGRGFLRDESDIKEGERADESGVKKLLI